MKPQISIGYLPILDHLTLGVAQHNEGADFETFTLQPIQFNNWNSSADALANNKIDGAFILFPLGLKLYRENPDISLLLLGHREGQVLVVDTEIEKVEDLRGKAVKIPHLYSTHHILLSEILKNAHLDIAKDISLKIGHENIKDAASEVDEHKISGLIIAEPLGTDVRKNKHGKILSLSKDFNPHHIDCVLVIKNKIIEDHPDAVQELIEGLVKAGSFINEYPRQAAEIGETFLGWNKKLLLESLTHDEGHILFWDLLPRIEDFEELQHLAVRDLKLWESEIDLKDFVKADFAKKAYRKWITQTRKDVKDKGEERTVPGSISETVGRIQKYINVNIQAISMKYVYPGDKYPLEIERMPKDMFTGQRFEEVLETKEITVEGLTPDAKAVSFLKQDHALEPDKVLFTIDVANAEKCLIALGFGENIYHIQDYKENFEQMFDPKKSVTALKKDSNVIFSLDYSVFKLIPMCLSQFN